MLDDAPYRSFDTMTDYRRWCEEHLPSWLGYGRRVEVEGFPVCHIDDVVARAKDRESLPRLRAFRDYWVERQRQGRER